MAIKSIHVSTYERVEAEQTPKGICTRSMQQLNWEPVNVYEKIYDNHTNASNLFSILTQDVEKDIKKTVLYQNEDT